MILENLIQQMREMFCELPDDHVEMVVADAVASYQEFGKALAIAIYFHGSTKADVDAGLEWWRRNYKASLVEYGVYETTAEQVSQIATDILVHEAYAVALNMSSEGGHA
jgi:hypothetical protein